MSVRAEITLPITVLLLLSAGLFILSSAAPDISFLNRQLIFVAMGVIMCALILLLGSKRILAAAFPLYGLSTALLVLTQLFGTEVNGAKSWLFLGPLPGFQPSEFAKLSLILALAKLLHDKPIKSLLDYIRPVVLMMIPFGLVFLEPDLGSALVIGAIGAGMILVRGIPWKHLLIFIVLFAVKVNTR